MKKIIISLDSYSWIRYCAGLILENSSEFAIMLVYKERGENGMLGCERLCMEAIASQRRHDIARIGRKLNIKRIINLNYEDFFDEDHLIINLKLESTFGNVKELYYPENKVLTPILEDVGNSMNIPTYSFGENINKSEKKRVDTNQFKDKLLEIKKIMIGISNVHQLEFPTIEKFY